MTFMTKTLTDGAAVGSKFAHAVDHLASAAGHVADTLGTRGGQLMAAQSRLGENVRSQVRSQPMIYLGAAVATGFLLSWLMQRR